MKYIDYINRFWDHHRLSAFSPLETALYFALLAECNRQHWPDSFRVPARFAQDALQRSYKTIRDVRQRLVDKGFIRYEVVDGVGYYSIVSNKDSNTDKRGSDGTPKGTPECSPEGTLQGSLQGTPEGTLQGSQNGNSTYLYKDKDIDIDKDISMCKDEATETHTSEKKKIKVPDIEATYWRYRA